MTARTLFERRLIDVETSLQGSPIGNNVAAVLRRYRKWNFEDKGDLEMLAEEMRNAADNIESFMEG